MPLEGICRVNNVVVVLMASQLHMLNYARQHFRQTRCTLASAYVRQEIDELVDNAIIIITAHDP